MHKLTGWSARRSGPAMTVHADGGVKVPNVKLIEVVGGRVEATDVGNQRFELVTDAPAPRLIDRINDVLGGDADPCVKLSDIRMLLDSAA
jgi:hypothetical protein